MTASAVPRHAGGGRYWPTISGALYVARWLLLIAAILWMHAESGSWLAALVVTYALLLFAADVRERQRRG